MPKTHKIYQQFKLIPNSIRFFMVYSYIMYSKVDQGAGTT